MIFLRFKLVSLLLLLSLLVFGCAQMNAPAKKPEQNQQNQQAEQIIVDTELAEQAKNTAKSVEGVEDATSVVIDRKISTAIKVSGFDRLKLKSIKEEAHAKIKKLNKDYTVLVTSDKKLFKQLQEIEKQLNTTPKEPLTEIKKMVDKINKDMHG